jgi:tetratricopeptide (TPR) repeat protein
MRVVWIGMLFVWMPASAQWVLMREDADSLTRQGIFHIYNLQFDSAEAYFGELIRRYPDHPAGYFMDAMVSWWKILSSRRTRQYDEEFLQKIARVLQVCEPILQRNPYDIVGLFFKGGALGYRGRFYAMRERWIPAANDGREAFNILLQVQRLAPSNHDVLLGTGIYNYYAAKLPEMYPILRPLLLFLPPGDKELGILQLRASARHARYAATEARVVCCCRFSTISSKTPLRRSPLPKSCTGTIRAIRTSIATWGAATSGWGTCSAWRRPGARSCAAALRKWTGYDELTAREALYYVGLALMQRGQYEEALQYFYKCDELSRVLDEDPSGFMVKTNLNIGKIYDLQASATLR